MVHAMALQTKILVWLCCGGLWINHRVHMPRSGKFQDKRWNKKNQQSIYVTYLLVGLVYRLEATNSLKEKVNASKPYCSVLSNQLKLYTLDHFSFFSFQDYLKPWRQKKHLSEIWIGNVSKWCFTNKMRSNYRTIYTNISQNRLITINEKTDPRDENSCLKKYFICW